VSEIRYMLRVGDVFKVEKTYGNGVTRSERWTIEGKNRRGSVLLGVSYTQENGVPVTLKRKETVRPQCLTRWADQGRRVERGTGMTL
jgi:hypothetical protein